MANVSALIRELADSMKALNAPDSDRMATINAAANTTGALAYQEKLLADLAAKYRDKPCPRLSAKALGKPTEHMRPLRDGSKWVLPE